MVKSISKGTCYLCNSTFSKATMTRHIRVCKQKNVVNATSESKIAKNTKNTKNTKTFHLVVEGDGIPAYWLHLAARANAKLSDLDTFLRNTWLECCGHMSDFTIAGQSYSASPDGEFDDQDMDIVLDKVLMPKIGFHHQYDYGTTTSLKIRVVSEWQEVKSVKSVTLLARNEPPMIKCDFCENIAISICSDCEWNCGKGLFCDKCRSSKHECEEDMLLPIVNSPRLGMCAYTG